MPEALRRDAQASTPLGKVTNCLLSAFSAAAYNRLCTQHQSDDKTRATSEYAHHLLMRYNFILLQHKH